MNVQLPFVPSSLDLKTALDHLKTQKRSALIAEHEGKYLLFTAANIAAGLHGGETVLANLRADETVAVAQTEKETKTVSVVVGAATGGVESRGWTSTVSDFILKKVGTTALIKIGNDVLAFRYSAGPTGYCCDGPNHHDDFPPPEVSVGDDCPHRDGHKVIAI